MGWHARLSLDYAVEHGRCVARFEHDGPLRILQALYPEGDGVCHSVLVHPPGGLVGGDTLEIAIHARAGAHGLVTTPGASRFYRSQAGPAVQRVRIGLDEGSRLEWLPLEAICYSGCIAQNEVSMALAPGSELMGWDIAALGLPESGQPFASGSLLQHLELEGAWLERGHIDAGDTRLLDGPLGLAGHRCVATLFLAAGGELPRPRREEALELARAVATGHPLAASVGATSPCGQVVVVRVLAPLVEPVLDLFKAIRDAWRPALWGVPADRPRGWAT